MAEIYLDHAATTAMLPEVLEAMLPYYTKTFYNPSSIYRPAQRVKRAVGEAREHIASIIGAEPEEIFFTSGGTEADNWVLTAFGRRRDGAPGHIVTSAVEHHAVGHTCKRLEEAGCRVTTLPVDGRGRIRLENLKHAVRPDTTLISILYANNEIGTIQPVAEIGAAAEELGVPFHTDAVQACGQIPIHVRREHIHLMSASAHKFRGPKGVGFLYAARELPLRNLFEGGGQERGLRAGTENVPGIIGMEKALSLAADSMAARRTRETLLRDHMIRRIRTEIPYVRVNGHQWFRLPNNVSIALRFVNSESLLILLDMEGVCASGGSACNSGSSAPSHVIQAIGVPEEYAGGVLRFTLGEENTIGEIDRVVDILKSKVRALRAESPEYEDFRKREARSDQ